MIVLDEQLLGRGLERAIARWYRGNVCFITDLRPRTIIKDEAIPTLLRQARHPTLVTINEQDFWQRVAIDHRFCVICCAFTDAQVPALNLSLKMLLRHPRFRSKVDRMGCVIRLSGANVTCYRHDGTTIRLLEQ